jgi:hypothetical protein
MPGLKLIGDISCFPTGEGRLYLATVFDLCSKLRSVSAAGPRGNCVELCNAFRSEGAHLLWRLNGHPGFGVLYGARSGALPSCGPPWRAAITLRTARCGLLFL